MSRKHWFFTIVFVWTLLGFVPAALARPTVLMKGSTIAGGGFDSFIALPRGRVLDVSNSLSAFNRAGFRQQDILLLDLGSREILKDPGRYDVLVYDPVFRKILRYKEYLARIEALLGAAAPSTFTEVLDRKGTFGLLLDDTFLLPKTCVRNLAARAKLTKIQLTWTPILAASYNIYRSTVEDGPFQLIGNTNSTYSTFLDTGPLTIGTVYYYFVRPVSFVGDETCASNMASARPTTR